MGNRLLYFNKYILVSVVIALAITTTLYAINMAVIRDTPVVGIRLAMAIFAGTFVGYLFGYLYNLRLVKGTIMQNAIDHQKILNKILILSKQESSLQKILDQSIQHIIKAPFCQLQSKGAIFIKEKNNLLTLKSHYNMSAEMLNYCGKNGVKFGECICGMAAEKKKIILKVYHNKGDIKQYKCNDNYGHYNVPILHEDTILGVLVVYLNPNHTKSKLEINFLESIANVLSLILLNSFKDEEATRNQLVLREVQHFAGIGTWIKNVSTGKITASKEVFDIMGYKPNEIELSEKFFLDATYKPDVEKLKEAVEKAKKGTAFELELRQYKKDGTIISVINKCKPAINADGSVTEVSGTLIDVSNIRNNEAALNEKQLLIEGILKASPDPLYLLDLETSEFVYYNKAMEEVMRNNPIFTVDYPKKGVRLFREQVHSDDLKAYDDMNNAMRKSDDIYTLRFRTSIFGDSYRWIEQKSLVYHRRENGKVHQVLLLSKDISEKVHASNRVKKLNSDLVQQNRAIKKVNRELDQFVYSVSHDLRAPLASVLGLVNLSKLNPNADELKEYMTRIGVSIEKLDGFIKDILDYSRNARTKLDSQPINFKALFMDIIESIKSIDNPDIALDFTVNEDSPYCGDKRRISIIFNNLISNAVKYADYSKAKRFLKVRIVTSKNGCEFYFEDNGIGIERESLAKVFNMFFRATELSDGSGLGLYIVKEAVSKMHGTIDINSEVGVGTSIIIQLPNKTIRTNKV